MAFRPTPGLDVLRTLCRRPHVRSTFVRPSPAFVGLNVRHLSSTAPRALFGFGKKDAENATPPPGLAPGQLAPNHAAAERVDVDPNDVPLTDFQRRIADLETVALGSRSSPDAKDQLALLAALKEGNEFAGLCKYYEIVALAPPGSPEASVALLRSPDAFELYTNALAQSGRMSELGRAVRTRDERIAAAGIAAAPSASQILSQVQGQSPAAAPSATPSILNSTSAASPLATGTAPGAAPGAVPGSPLQPIYVQLAPATPTSTAWRTVRWLLGMLLWGFVLLTIMSMVMESTGLLKAGPGPAEFEPEEGKVVKFSDVHGVEEAKNELQEVVEFLKNPEKFSNLGGKLPKGVLLTGPPGTGKTMLARAVAGEAGVPFLFASGSSFDEMFVGVGAKRVRELFAAARKKAPAIIFIDELDAIGSKRSAKDQHYMKQTLNQLLVELDGFEQSEGVIIIAATNFPQSLDKALTRPGRFDRNVVVPLPDVRGRIEILKHHMTGVSKDVDVDPSIIARGCPGMSGADLQNLVNQAAVKASREGATSVQLKHFEWAKDRILMGAERRSHYVTDASKRSTAYHEGGHALVAMHTPGAMPLHKVTIMPRGQALGITFQLPEQDKDSYTRQEYLAMIDVALGGRAAEDMIFGYDNVTSGCSSDLEKASEVATRMIRNFGYSDKIGLVSHGDQESLYLSDQKKDEIEGEIRSFLDKSMSRAKKVLTTHEDQLHRLAAALVEYETLDTNEVKKVLAGEKLDREGSLGEALKGEHEREEEQPSRV